MAQTLKTAADLIKVIRAEAKDSKVIPTHHFDGQPTEGPGHNDYESWQALQPILDQQIRHDTDTQTRAKLLTSNNHVPRLVQAVNSAAQKARFK